MTAPGTRLQAELPAGPWVVIAPRLQDVVASMGGALVLARRSGLRINVFLLGATDAEVEAACVLLSSGIATAPADWCTVRRIDAISGRDGAPTASPASVRRLSDAIASIEFSSVFFPSPWSADRAARIAVELVHQCLGDTGNHFVGYAFETARQEPVNLLIDISDTFDDKRRLLQQLDARTLFDGRVEVPLAINQARTLNLPVETIAAEAFLAIDQGPDPTLGGWPQWPVQQALPEPSPVGRLPLVSVIVRTKDRPHLLQEALASVAGQRYPNVEAVVVNDGGRDIAEIVAPFEPTLARLGLIQLGENQGRGHAGNLGLNEARGDYLCFLDDDDWFLPEHISALVNELLRAPAYKAAYAGVRCVGRKADGDQWEELYLFNEPFDGIRLLYDNYLPMHAVLFHRSLMESGCALDEELEIYEDWDFWIQLAQHTAFAHVDNVSAYYRIGADSGFGIKGNPDAIRQGLDKLFGKWHRLWTPKTLRTVIELARGTTLDDTFYVHLRRLQSSKLELIEASGKLRELEHQTEQLGTDKHALEAAVEERDARIAEQQKTISLQEAQSESAKLETEKIHQEKRFMEQRISELSANLRESRARIDTLQLQETEHQRALQQAQDEARDTQAALTSTRDSLAQREKALEQAQHEARELHAALTSAHESLAQVYASTSWRLTRPVRALGLGLRALRSTGHAPAVSMGIKQRLSASWSNSRRVMEEQGLAELTRRALAKVTNRPLVSVVITAEPGTDLRGTDLRASVQSVVDHSGGYRYEVLIVETDQGTIPPDLAHIGPCRVVRADQPDSPSNWVVAVQRARADVMLLLRAGVRVAPSCLHQLLQTCLAHPEAGLVGAKLLYPDGALCSAGGILKKDGSTVIYGDRDNCEKPEYNYVRDAVFLPAGAAALTKHAFAAARGRLVEYRAWPHRAIDLSIAVRDAGFRVVYQPTAVAVSEYSAMHRADADDKQAFKTRWQRTAHAQSLREEFAPFLSRDYGVRRRILVVDYVMITPDQDSGSLRMANMLGVLQELGYKITFVAFNLELHLPYGAQLQQQGIEVLYAPFTYSIPKYLAEHGSDFDIVLLSRADIADALLDAARTAAPSARIWFDTVDLHFLRELRMAEHEGCDLRAKDAQVRMQQELSLVDRADVTLVVSPVEKALIEEHRPSARVEIVSNIHRIYGSAMPFKKRSGLLFIGGFGHPPNTDAIRYFVGEILPLVRATLGDVELTIVGSRPPEEVLAMGQQPGITVTGYVPDVSDLFAKARLSIAPLRYGAGVKGKVNQSMAYGVPVVATSIAVEGMYLEDGRDVLVADEAPAFANAVIRLYNDRALWEQLSRNGLDNLERYFSRQAARTVLERLVREAETAA